MKNNQTTNGLRVFRAVEYNYGFIEGASGYIVTETDFCHQLRTLNENIELRVRAPWECENNEQRSFRVFTLEELREIATPITSYREWAHYWGIKHRIADNYRELLKSMRQIGAATSAMPKWGEEVATPPKSATSDAEWDEAIRESQAREANARL